MRNGERKKSPVRRRLGILLLVALLLSAVAAGLLLNGKRLRTEALATARVQGLEAFDRGDYETAEVALTRYCRSSPGDAFALSRLADALLGQVPLHPARVEQAIHLLQQVSQLDGADQGVPRRLLELLILVSKPSEAIALADELIAAGDDRAVTRRIKARALTDLRRYDDALKAIEQALALEPADLGANLLAVEIDQKLGRTREQIIERVSGVRALMKDEVEGHLLMAAAHWSLNDRSQATTWLRQAAALPVQDRSTLFALVRLLDEALLPGESLTVLERFARTNNDQDSQKAVIRHYWELGAFRMVEERLASLGELALKDSELMGGSSALSMKPPILTFAPGNPLA